MTDDVLDDIFTPKLVFENEYYRFYTDSWTDQYKSSLRRYDTHGTSNDCKQVYLLESKKDGERFYVAFDSQSKPFLQWTDSWNFEMNLTIYNMNQRERTDIINMAKKVNGCQKD